MSQNNLSDYYQHIQKNGKLRTTTHAERWSRAVLRTLGLNLSRGAKKKLAKSLPEELANDLNRAFWLLHFRNPNMTQDDFLKQVARRSGNTDVDFARYPTTAVFGSLKRYTDDSVSSRVAESLSPEVREMWKNA